MNSASPIKALRAQVVWGGRLGTNLIEIGCIDLDELSRALGQQHGVPAALERHFEKADPALQAQLPPELAEELSVVPIVRLSPQRIAVVALGPLRRDALDAISRIYGCDPRDGIVVSVAPELRVLYHLERVYGVAPRIVRRHDVADDVTQEAFLKAYQALSSFDLARPFGPWICRIARLMASDVTRSATSDE